MSTGHKCDSRKTVWLPHRPRRRRRFRSVTHMPAAPAASPAHLRPAQKTQKVGTGHLDDTEISSSSARCADVAGLRAWEPGVAKIHRQRQSSSQQARHPIHWMPVEARRCRAFGSLRIEVAAIRRKAPSSARFMLFLWRCHIVERRTREFCKRARLPRATCS